MEWGAAWLAEGVIRMWIDFRVVGGYRLKYMLQLQPVDWAWDLFLGKA